MSNVIDLAAVRKRKNTDREQMQQPDAYCLGVTDQNPVDDLIARAASLNPDVFLYGSELDQARELARCGFVDVDHFEREIDLLAILYNSEDEKGRARYASLFTQDFDMGA